MAVRMSARRRIFSLTKGNTDVHTGNILLHFPNNMRRMNVRELYDKIGQPVTEGITRTDGAPLSPNIPAEVVWPARLEVESYDISPSRHLPAMLSDFGESFEPFIEKRCHARTRPTLIPPESFFAKEGSSTISFPAGIWTLGCTMVEIMGGGAPFDTWADRNAIVSEHVMALGKLPDPWWDQWSARNLYFNDDATIYLPENRWLDDSIEKRYEYCVAAPRSRYGEDVPPDVEKRAFIEMLKTMLVLDPNKRATIDQIVSCEWMQQWAIPESQRVRDRAHADLGGA
jgi:serine/threonine-protein kinase SRPK3